MVYLSFTLKYFQIIGLLILCGLNKPKINSKFAILKKPETDEKNISTFQ